jgi:hypothetical protein
MLYAEAPKARMPSSGYDPRQKEKDAALELYLSRKSRTKTTRTR